MRIYKTSGHSRGFWCIVHSGNVIKDSQKRFALLASRGHKMIKKGNGKPLVKLKTLFSNRLLSDGFLISIHNLLFISGYTVFILRVTKPQQKRNLAFRENHKLLVIKLWQKHKTNSLSGKKTFKL